MLISLFAAIFAFRICKQ
ncbi:hypothetical protein [Burkholderia ubonensis]